eukprot:347005-Rhodomonas_salina.3
MPASAASQLADNMQDETAKRVTRASTGSVSSINSTRVALKLDLVDKLIADVQGSVGTKMLNVTNFRPPLLCAAESSKDLWITLPADFWNVEYIFHGPYLDSLGFPCYMAIVSGENDFEEE